MTSFSPKTKIYHSWSRFPFIEFQLTIALTRNGFANRIDFVCAKRSKILPDPSNPDPILLAQLQERIRHAVQYARGVNAMKRDEDAKAIWREAYPSLSEGKQGLLGAVTSRAEAQVVRLSLLYALLDRSDVIRAPHLMAALAAWEYAEASAKFVFGDKRGDPVADQILHALKCAPQGMTRTEISRLFHRHKETGQIDRALNELAEQALVKSQEERTEGRTAIRWFCNLN